MKGSEFMWRNAEKEELMIIKKKYLTKEIFSALLVAALDVCLVLFYYSLLPKDFESISSGYIIMMIPISLLFFYLFFYTFRSIFKSAKEVYLISTNKFTVADCKLDEVKVNRIGWLNNANVEVSTSDGESYRTSYSSAFTTKVAKGQSALLMLFGKNMELMIR